MNYLFSFLLVSKVKFHKIKKIFMVFIYSLRPIYTFLCTIINGNIIASFVQKRNVLRFCGPKKKKINLRTYATLESPTPVPLHAIVRNLAWPLPTTFVRTYFVDDPVTRFHLFTVFVKFIFSEVEFI